MNAFNVGDVCITQRGQTMICDGSLVVVIAVRPGLDTPYEIRKLSGEPFPVCGRGRRLFFGNFETVLAAEHNLRRPDLREGWTDQEAIEQRSMQRRLERAVFGEGA